MTDLRYFNPERLFILCDIKPDTKDEKIFPRDMTKQTFA